MMRNALSISYIKLDIAMKTNSGVILPEWTGSMIRGALGNELLALYCTRGDTEYKCHECSEKCSAGILFASGSSVQSEERVSPYLVSCCENNFDGKTIHFEITLFSEGTETVNDILKVLRNGLKFGVSRAEFELDSIKDGVTGEVIFDGLYMIKPEIHDIAPVSESVEKLYVEFVTPYKTKISAESFGFEHLVRAMLRRISTLLRQQRETFEIDYYSLLEKASLVKIKYRDIKIVKTQRYSNRSESKMEVSGFTGLMVFDGDISPFMPLFRITEIIHAGKMCVMGLGEIRAVVIK